MLMPQLLSKFGFYDSDSRYVTQKISAGRKGSSIHQRQGQL
jgi:hypothetical protein